MSNFKVNLPRQSSSLIKVGALAVFVLIGVLAMYATFTVYVEPSSFAVQQVYLGPNKGTRKITRANPGIGQVAYRLRWQPKSPSTWGHSTPSPRTKLLFSAPISRQTYAGRQLELLASKLTAGSFAPLITHLVAEKKISRDEIDRIRDILGEEEPG